MEYIYKKVAAYGQFVLVFFSFTKKSVLVAGIQFLFMDICGLKLSFCISFSVFDILCSNLYYIIYIFIHFGFDRVIHKGTSFVFRVYFA